MANEQGPSIAPSLLARPGAGNGSSTAPGILADLEGRAASPARSASTARAGRLRWLVLPTFACVVVAIAVVARVGGGQGSTRPAAVEAAADPPVATQSATVFDEPPPTLVSAREPEPAADMSSGIDPLRALLDGGSPMPDPARTRPAARRAAAPAASAASSDSDVDLLAALMAHAGPLTPSDAPPVRDGSTPRADTGVAAGMDAAHQRIAVRLSRCPAANTAEGLTCRQQACSEGWGEHPACPEPARRGPVPGQ